MWLPGCWRACQSRRPELLLLLLEVLLSLLEQRLLGGLLVLELLLQWQRGSWQRLVMAQGSEVHASWSLLLQLLELVPPMARPLGAGKDPCETQEAPPLLTRHHQLPWTRPGWVRA